MKKIFVLLVIVLLSGCNTTEEKDVSTSLINGNDIISLGELHIDTGCVIAIDKKEFLMDSVSNNIDENIIGEYVITYSYLDDEVTYNCTRFVKVIDSTRPEVTLNPGIDTIKINGVFIDAGVTCSDNYDTSLTVAISGSVDTGVMGRYILTYTVTDDSSNSTDIIRIVNVVN